MNKAVKITLTYILLPLLIIFLTVITVKSVMEPVEFNKEKAAREKVAIQQLKDIRDLQVAYKSSSCVFSRAAKRSSIAFLSKRFPYNPS